MNTETKLSITEKMRAAAAKGHETALKETAEATKPAPGQGPGSVPQPGSPTPHPGNAPKGPAKYKGNHVKRLVLRDGTIVLPDAEGLFDPKTQEQYDMLEHLAASTESSLEKI